jgi:hypothetical protein
MARRKVNRSQAIRDYLGAHPTATPSVIIDELKKKGIKVSPALVSAVKYHNKPTNGRRKKTARASTSAHAVDFDRLVEAKTLAVKMGGVEKARHALELLARLQA